MSKRRNLASSYERKNQSNWSLERRMFSDEELENAEKERYLGTSSCRRTPSNMKQQQPPKKQQKEKLT